MNAAKNQAKIWKGYGKAAAKLGTSYSFYRALASNRLLDEQGNPILSDDGRSYIQVEPVTDLLDETGQRILDESGNPIAGEVNSSPALFGASPLTLPSYASLLVSLNAEDMKYVKPNKYGKATWYGLFDATNSAVGDYLVGAGGTFFIAALQSLLPILLVECNRTISLLKPQSQDGVGIVPYYGNTQALETAVLTNWPASVLQGTKGEKTEAGLPGDTRAPWWTILLPYLAGVTINFDDVMTDDMGRRYIVSSCELTDLGYRVTAMQAVS